MTDTAIDVLTGSRPAGLAARYAVRRCARDLDAMVGPLYSRAAVHRLVRPDGTPATVPPLLLRFVLEALRAAELTEGAFDPTVGADSLSRARRTGGLAGCAQLDVGPRRGHSWRDVRVGRHQVTVPRHTLLDLTATSSAMTATGAAELLRCGLQLGAAVRVGSTWVVTRCARDSFTVPTALGAVALQPGEALAAVRSQEVLDPLTRRPVEGGTVKGGTVVQVRGDDAVAAKAVALECIVRLSRGEDVGRRVREHRADGAVAEVRALLPDGTVHDLVTAPTLTGTPQC